MCVQTLVDRHALLGRADKSPPCVTVKETSYEEKKLKAFKDLEELSENILRKKNPFLYLDSEQIESERALSGPLLSAHFVGPLTFNTCGFDDCQ